MQGTIPPTNGGRIGVIQTVEHQEAKCSLESMMGRAKRLLSGTAEGTTNSLTRQTLSLVTCTHEITPTLVHAALSTVPIKCVSKWFSDNFERSVNY